MDVKGRYLSVTCMPSQLMLWHYRNEIRQNSSTRTLTNPDIDVRDALIILIACMLTARPREPEGFGQA